MSGVSNLPSHLVVLRGRKIAERSYLAFYTEDLTADIFNLRELVSWMRPLLDTEQLLADVLLVGHFGYVDDLVPPAIVAVRGQGALNDVVPCQLAKVVVRERPDVLRRRGLLVPTDVLARGHIAVALFGVTLRRDQVVHVIDTDRSGPVNSD
jgi:hypothetical protein